MDHYSFTIAERTIMTHITGSFIDEIGSQIITSFRSVLDRSDTREISISDVVFKNELVLFVQRCFIHFFSYNRIFLFHSMQMRCVCWLYGSTERKKVFILFLLQTATATTCKEVFFECVNA